MDHDCKRGVVEICHEYEATGAVMLFCHGFSRLCHRPC